MNHEKTKRVYEKPVLTQVELRPEEAVLGACKAGGSAGGPASSGCTGVSNCNTLAS